MRTGIISDIHSNREALETVLQDMALQKVEKVWCLGDIVGNGPDPNECINLVRFNNMIYVAGNRDHDVAGVMESLDFDSDIDDICLWTRAELTNENMEYIKAMPLKLVIGDFTLVHGSPRESFEYITSSFEAKEALLYLKSLYCLFGHSHTPMIIKLNEETKRHNSYPTNLRKVTLTDHATFINPGSVGQPRDGNPKASYMIYDSDSNQVMHRRVAYDIDSTKRRMMSAGFPASFDNGLLYGR